MIETRMRTMARTSFIFAAALFLVIATQASNAQPSDTAKGFGLAYDATREVTLTGIVQQVVSHPAPGSAVGLHLLIATEQQTIDAHVGPFLSQENREALAPGESVKVIGVKADSHGQSVFLVRQLSIGERQITVRNPRGFLIREAPTRRTQNKPALTGGAQ